MHRNGRLWAGVAIVLLLLVPMAIALYLGVPLQTAGLWAAILNVGIIYIPTGIVEVITYAPMLGTGATYLAFITGNLSNLKVPCAMNAREIVGTEFGTKENEIVSTLSVAVSSLVTCLILAGGVLLIIPLEPFLQAPALKPAFDNILPALFGALGFTYFLKSPKIAILPFIIMVTLCLVYPAAGKQVGFLIPISAVIAMVWARILYKKNKI
ncbi:MAG: hypothetical protein GX786_00040 [Clostridiales bacterium]|nr:hypothetical protein [Clostridiales bacterium]